MTSYKMGMITYVQFWGNSHPRNLESTKSRKFGPVLDNS